MGAFLHLPQIWWCWFSGREQTEYTYTVVIDTKQRDLKKTNKHRHRNTDSKSWTGYLQGLQLLLLLFDFLCYLFLFVFSCWLIFLQNTRWEILFLFRSVTSENNFQTIYNNMWTIYIEHTKYITTLVGTFSWHKHFS